MWEDSLLNTYLQSSSVLSNSNVIPSSWINEISSVKWNNGIFNSSWPQRNGETIYVFESEEVTSSTYKVGLMYLSDYFYANNKGVLRIVLIMNV